MAPLIVAKGHVEVDMNRIILGLGLKLKTQITPDGRQVVAVEAVDIVCWIDSNDIKIHIGGGVWSDLAKIFESAFKGTIADSIGESVRKALG